MLHRAEVARELKYINFTNQIPLYSTRRLCDVILQRDSFELSENTTLWGAKGGNE